MSRLLIVAFALFGIGSAAGLTACPNDFDTGAVVPECNVAAQNCASGVQCRESPPLVPFTGNNDGCCFPASAFPTTTPAVPIVTARPVTVAASCVDLLNPLTGVSDCPSRAALCKDPVYDEVMKVQCRRTCGYCGSNASNNSTIVCGDLSNPTTGINECPARRSLCTDPIYAPLMAIQCKATCGLC